MRLIDVAEKAGVSLTSASFAMSGRPGVSEPVAARVRAIAAELGYVPNMQARSLASGASSTIGLVVHDLADPYFAELASAAVESATQLGLTVQICQNSRDPAQEREQVRLLIASRVRGIIVAGSGRTDAAEQQETYEELKRFAASGGRVAMIGRHRTPLDAIVPENHTGGQLIGEHLAGLGHRTVGIAAGPPGLITASERLKGLLEALDESGVQTVVSHTRFTHAGGEEACINLLDRAPSLTAIAALNDAMAAGVLTALRGRGLSIPEAVSVTGFDDVRVAADLGPGLTTLRLPLSEMGNQAVQLILKPTVTKPRKVNVPAELIKRGSTAPPPS